MASCSKTTVKSRNWTETELKYFSLILVDEKYEYARQLDTLALKKSANMRVFEEIKQRFEDYMSEEFIRDNNCEKRGLKSKNKDIPLNISPEKLRVKFK